MKKLQLIVFTFIVVTCLGSCTKNYTCECTVDQQVRPTEFERVNRRDAKTLCEQAELTFKATDPNASCTLN